MILTLAWRYILSKNRDPFLVMVVRIAFGGIALGVAALIVVLSVMRGFHQELIDRIVQAEGHIKIGGDIEKRQWIPHKNLLEALHSHPDIVRVAPVIEGRGAFMFDGVMMGVDIRGGDREVLSKESMITAEWDSTHMSDNGCVMTAAMAGWLGVIPGDEVELFLPRVHNTMLGVIPLVIPLKVCDVIANQKRSHASTILVLDDFARKMLDMPNGSFHMVDLFVRDPENMDHIIQFLKDKGIQTSCIHTWKSRNKTFIETLNVERKVMGIILTFIILIAGFNVISGLMMFVRDKRYDAALLRLLGFSASYVQRIYLTAGMVIAMSGVLVGEFVGWLICYYIEEIRRFVEYIFKVDFFKEEFYMLAQVPADCTAELLITVALTSFALAFFSVLLPAMRASRHGPMECFRYGA